MLAGRLDDSYSVEVRHAMTPMTVAKIGANSAVRYSAPFIAAVASGLHVSLTTVGTALGIAELVGLTAPLIVRGAVRFTRRTAMSLGLIGIAIGAGVSATSRNIVMFAVGLSIMNLTKIVFDTGIIGWLTDRIDYARLGRVIGLTETAWALALLSGVVLMGLATGIWSWRWGYVLALIFVVVLSVVLRQTLPTETSPPPPVRVERHARPQLGAGWFVIVGTVALTAAAQAMFVTFGKWLQTEFDVTDTQLTIVIFGLGAAELLAASSTVRFLDRWGKQASVMYGAALIVPAGLALAVLHHHLAIGLILLGVFIVGFEFSILATLSLANNLVPDQPSVGLGFMVGAGTLGRAIMASPATAAFSHNGMWAPSVLGASCAAVTIACQWRFRVSRLAPVVQPL
ncbi:MAG TPA: MFS transporter [Ilumatobacteraceae bacterium]